MLKKQKRILQGYKERIQTLKETVKNMRIAYEEVISNLYEYEASIGQDQEEERRLLDGAGNYLASAEHDLMDAETFLNAALAL